MNLKFRYCLGCKYFLVLGSFAYCTFRQPVGVKPFLLYKK